jgi:hypothetical protein
MHEQPDLKNLKVYGCKTYVQIIYIPCLQKLKPRALIGYLVGYVAYNIWRIWIPAKHKVICARDCIFNEIKLYKQKIKHKLINDQNNQSLEALSREEFDQLIKQTVVQTIEQNTNQSN